jgi:hypothetical protein
MGYERNVCPVQKEDIISVRGCGNGFGRISWSEKWLGAHHTGKEAKTLSLAAWKSGPFPPLSDLSIHPLLFRYEDWSFQWHNCLLLIWPFFNTLIIWFQPISLPGKYCQASDLVFTQPISFFPIIYPSLSHTHPGGSILSPTKSTASPYVYKYVCIPIHKHSI